MKNSKFYLPIILLISFITFLPSLGGEFLNWDDDWIIENNKICQNISIENIKIIIFDLTYSTRMILGAEYLPIRDFSVMTDFAIYGANSHAHHLTNLLLYVLILFFVYRFSQSLVKNDTTAFLIAIFFAILPVHVEPVAWLSARKDLLSALFFFISLYCYTKDKKTFYYLTVIFYTLALFSKSASITLPLVLIAYDKLERGKFRLVSYLLFLAPLVSSLLLNMLVGKIVGMFDRHIDGSEYITALSMMHVVYKYIESIFLPLSLSPIYSVVHIKSVLSSVFITSLITTLLTILLAIVLSIKYQKQFGFSILFFFIMLLPVLQIIPIQNKMADRYIFVPSYGFAVFFILMLRELFNSYATRLDSRLRGNDNKIKIRKILLVFPVCYFVFLFSISFHNSFLWRNNETLWNSAISKDSNNYTPYYNLGLNFMKKGDYQLATNYFQSAIYRNTDNIEVYNNLGIVFIKMGNFKGAESVLKAGLRVNPTYKKLYQNLGEIYVRTGNPKKSINYFKKAIELDSEYYIAKNSLGIALLQMGYIEIAQRFFKEALETNPDYHSAKKNLLLIDRIKKSNKKK